MRALSSAGRAVLLQSKGQEFESPRVHLRKKCPSKDGLFSWWIRKTCELLHMRGDSYAGAIICQPTNRRGGAQSEEDD